MKNDTDILIVEDGSAQTNLLVEKLRVGGYATQTATDRRDVLESTCRNHPAPIEHDTRKSDMDGLELCLTLKHGSCLHQVPPLLLTSLSAPADVLSALQAGASFYVTIPDEDEFRTQFIATLIHAIDEGVEEERGATDPVRANDVPRHFASALKRVVKLLAATYKIAFRENQALSLACEVTEALNETLAQKVQEQTALLTTEIAKRKQLEACQELALDVLQALNEPGDFKENIRHILAELLSWADVEAGGMRLQEGPDFPYFATQGFNADFVLKESTLTRLCKGGVVCRDKDGKACLDCLCGLVISGRTNPANPLFTQGGSFWTNNASPLLAPSADQEHQGSPRNECVRQGYASVALIPIKAKSMIVGILHLCSRRQGCFSSSTIERLEGIAVHLGEALACKLAEEALKASERDFLSLAESMPQIVWIARPDGQVIYFNQQWVTYTGLTLDESYGHGWSRPFHPDDRQRAWNAWQDAAEKDTLYSVNCRLRRVDGTYRWWQVRGVPMHDANGKRIKWFGTCTDIENIKQGETLIASRLEELWYR